jgi:hypothetical protein
MNERKKGRKVRKERKEGRKEKDEKDEGGREEGRRKGRKQERKKIEKNGWKMQRGLTQYGLHDKFTPSVSVHKAKAIGLEYLLI